MLAALVRYKLIAEGLAALALLSAVLYGFHRFCEYEQDIGSRRKQDEWNLADAKRDKADAELALAREKAVSDAVSQGVQREATIKTLAASSAAAATSLRDTVAVFQRGNQTATIETLIKRADTAGNLLGDCAAQYRSVAEKADRHASDARTLSEAWPTN